MGSVDAEQWWRRLFPKLVGMLSLYCGDPWLAEELVQETLSRLWEQSQRPSIVSPEAWGVPHRDELGELLVSPSGG